VARTKVEKALFLAHKKGMQMPSGTYFNSIIPAPQDSKRQLAELEAKYTVKAQDNTHPVFCTIENVRFGLFTPRWRGEHYLSSLSMQKFCAMTLRRSQERWHQRRAEKLWREHLDATAQAKKDATRFLKIQQKEYVSDDEEFMAIAEDIQNWINETREEYGSLDMVSAQKQRDAVQKQKDAKQKDAERQCAVGNVQNNVIQMFKPT
jgi:hypothetical protein|tara:strand:- start:198 stop:815 length:618 start_codon:yes stop_codon:yes gene_type:complete